MHDAKIHTEIIKNPRVTKYILILRKLNNETTIVEMKRTSTTIFINDISILVSEIVNI